MNMIFKQTSIGIDDIDEVKYHIYNLDTNTTLNDCLDVTLETYHNIMKS